MSINQFFQPTNLKRTLFFILFDVFISIATIFLAYLLRFNFEIPPQFFEGMLTMVLIFVPLKILVFFLFKIYFIAWRYFGLVEYKRIIFSHFWVYLFFTGVFLLLEDSFNPFPRSVILIDLFLSLFFIGFIRISKRLYLENGKPCNQKKMLLFGRTDSATTHIIKSALGGEIPYHPIAIISDEPNTLGTYFSNVKVYAENQLHPVIEKYEIEAVVITQKLEQKALDKLFTRLSDYGVHEIKIVQMFQDDRPKLKDISIEDLLARKPKDLDRITIANFIAGKVVMITGAGGSIGSELVRQVNQFGAKEVILVDHSEFNLYAIKEEFPDSKNIPVMQNVKDKALLEKSFKKYQPEILLHAAAYKHVPLCEANVVEAIENNVYGTKNVIDLAIEYKVQKLVLISTDKAVRPTNVMGTTKRICELYAQSVPSNLTEIVAVRFGNVLGSSGSVIPKFKSQIEKGAAITVTDPEITRYFMLIPEACQLVLQAASIAKGGELFILDMGEPIKIVDLAKKMIELSGRDDIEIVFTGLREGEKLYEELLINESDLKTEYNSIMVSQDEPMNYEVLMAQMKSLKSGDELSWLKKMVPEFSHKTLEEKR